jgi:hypothetical protein
MIKKIASNKTSTSSTSSSKKKSSKSSSSSKTSIKTATKKTVKKGSTTIKNNDDIPQQQQQQPQQQTTDETLALEVDSNEFSEETDPKLKEIAQTVKQKKEANLQKIRKIENNQTSNKDKSKTKSQDATAEATVQKTENEQVTTVKHENVTDDESGSKKRSFSQVDSGDLIEKIKIPPKTPPTTPEKSSLISNTNQNNNNNLKQTIMSRVGLVINREKSKKDDDSDNDYPSSDLSHSLESRKRLKNSAPPLASVIRVSERKYSVPKSMQPSKSILLQALNAANSSVKSENNSQSIASRLKRSIADERLSQIRKTETEKNQVNTFFFFS